MEKKQKRERKTPSFKSYVITGSILYSACFALLQFLIKPYLLVDTYHTTVGFVNVCLEIVFVFILLISSFIRNILCIKKDYKCRDDYNRPVSVFMITYMAVLLLIAAFVW